MDGDFEKEYLAAEKAYGAGDFGTAAAISSTLLSQLESLPESGAERDALMAWRAFVALLMGHIQLYGLGELNHAAHHYKLVLDSQPDTTLRELAEQGLDRCQSQSELQQQAAATQSEEAVPSPAVADQEAAQAIQPESRTSAPLPELLRDPFLKADTAINNQANGAELPPFLQHQDPAEAIAKDANSKPSTDLIRDPFLSPESTSKSATNTQAITPAWLKLTNDNDGNSTPEASSQAAKEHFDDKSSDQESAQKLDEKNQSIESEIIEQA
ncbi:MAG: hypothetical protein GY914_05775, partial [Prochlorococcus sp.]|nr:hypothetical protein [Prochlorococcus sp.]